MELSKFKRLQADAAAWYLKESSFLCLELFETIFPTDILSNSPIGNQYSQAGFSCNKLRKCFRKTLCLIDFENSYYKEIIYIFLTYILYI